MERTKQLLALLFVAAAFGLLFVSVRQAKIADQSAPGLIAVTDAKDAIDFTLPAAGTGHSVRLQEAVKAHPVVLDFWASWCGPCRAEMPHLQALSQKYQGRVAFYGVNSTDPPSYITDLAKQINLTYPTLSDSKHNVAFLYGADAIPLLVLVDTQGRTRSVISGYDPHENIEASLSKTLDALLAEQRRTR